MEKYYMDGKTGQIEEANRTISNSSAKSALKWQLVQNPDALNLSLHTAASFFVLLGPDIHPFRALHGYFGLGCSSEYSFREKMFIYLFSVFRSLHKYYLLSMVYPFHRI